MKRYYRGSNAKPGGCLARDLVVIACFGCHVAQNRPTAAPVAYTNHSGMIFSTKLPVLWSHPRHLEKKNQIQLNIFIFKSFKRKLKKRHYNYAFICFFHTLLITANNSLQVVKFHKFKVLKPCIGKIPLPANWLSPVVLPPDHHKDLIFPITMFDHRRLSPSNADDADECMESN